MLAIYIVVVFGMVVITSALLIYILNRIEMLNYRMILALSLSSILAALLFPGIFNLLSMGRDVMPDLTQLTFMLAATLVVFIVLSLILSIIISMVIPDRTFAAIASGFRKRVDEGMTPQTIEMAEASPGENIPQERNYLEEIYDTLVVETGKTGSNIDNIARQVENNLEISVDSEEIIDKMRIETFEQDNSILNDNLPQIETNPVVDILDEANGALDLAGRLSLDECVEEAFRLKGLGDCEGAILYFMYALDREPGKELTFWIVLDICVLYKAIGQVDFARDMLSTYFNTYNGLMDDQVRDEIERNLLYMEE